MLVQGSLSKNNPVCELRFVFFKFLSPAIFR